MRWAQWERKFLAAQLKLDFDDEEREELFLAWNVHRESKERKMQLARKLWAPDQTRHGFPGAPFLPHALLYPVPDPCSSVEKKEHGAFTMLSAAGTSHGVHDLCAAGLRHQNCIPFPCIGDRDARVSVHRRDQAGMLRSSELVMKLNGSDTEQAADTDGAYELVFGRSMGERLAAASH